MIPLHKYTSVRWYKNAKQNTQACTELYHKHKNQPILPYYFLSYHLLFFFGRQQQGESHGSVTTAHGAARCPKKSDDGSSISYHSLSCDASKPIFRSNILQLIFSARIITFGGAYWIAWLVVLMRTGTSDAAGHARIHTNSNFILFFTLKYN